MFKLRAEDKGLALSFEQAGNVPQYVRTDEGKLRQALSNLLGNAVKFTQQGGVVLRLTALSRPQDRVTLHFEVNDTGPGIAEQDLDSVFEPFVQTQTGEQVQEGSGLGLSISRQFVRLMGGDLTVTSKPGKGSTFRFDVQAGLAPPGASSVRVTQPRQRVLGLEPGQRAADGSRHRLLVAEDRKTNRQLLIRLLESLGFEVRGATNGQEAIDIWEQWSPHLIWMDMRMPVVDGYEATHRIKSAPAGQATAIVALTAFAFEEDREKILAGGCDDIVRKPFRQEEIFEMLAKHLGIRFVCEEIAPPATDRIAHVTPTLAPVLAPEALASLPATWLADLREATVRADLDRILSLIEQIRDRNPALADVLEDMAYDFEYQQILVLAEQAGDEE
jgi:CheY-like chemotaxis protein